MTQPYNMVGFGTGGYVPTVSENLLIGTSMNPARFPYNQYINREFVDKEEGYYAVLLNDSGNRVINDNDNLWADGADRPPVKYGNAPFTFKQYKCQRRLEPRTIGELFVRQSQFDAKALESQLAGTQICTARSKRIGAAISNTSNFLSGNSFNSSTYATDSSTTWANSTSDSLTIRNSLTAMANIINKASNGVIVAEDLIAVMNPNTARTTSSTQEAVDYLKQSPIAWELWKGGAQTVNGVPPDLFGFKIVVDNSVYTSSASNPQSGTAPTKSYCIPDNVVCVVSKKQAVEGIIGRSFSTFTLFCYADMEVRERFDERNRRWEIDVVEDVAEVVVAPFAGGVIQINA